MDKEYCRICDFVDNNEYEDQCMFWSCSCEDIDDCYDRKVDGMDGNE